jgi:hypothetical protein
VPFLFHPRMLDIDSQFFLMQCWWISILIQTSLGQ